MMRLVRLAAASVLLAAATPAAPSVQVSGAWARATAPLQDEAAVYFALASPAGDTLTAVASDDAAGAMLHRSTVRGGMAGMADMDDLALPAGRTVRLEPRGMHVMLTGLKHGLRAGDHVGLTLHFAHAGIVHVSVPVLPIGSAGPPGP